MSDYPPLNARAINLPGRTRAILVDSESVIFPAGTITGLPVGMVDDLCRGFLAALEAAPRPTPPAWVVTDPHPEDGSREGVQHKIANILTHAWWSPDDGAALYFETSLRIDGDMSVADARKLASVLTELADAIENANASHGL